MGLSYILVARARIECFNFRCNEPQFLGQTVKYILLIVILNIIDTNSQIIPTFESLIFFQMLKLKVFLKDATNN